jgi:hypothetical protein
MYPFYKYVFAQDELSYITIALKYYSGNYSDAINGIWSPLISWLLVPFIVIGTFPPFAVKILQIIVGFLILFIMSKLFEEFDIEQSVSTLFLCGLVIILLFFVFFTGTPDLLFAFLVILYIYLLITNYFSYSIKTSFVLGVLGCLIYLAKAYGFLFFILHFTLLNVIVFFFNKQKKGQILKSYFISILVFSFISSIWICAISNKYGTINYTLAGNYNYNLAGPKYNYVPIMRIETLYPPVNESAVSYWEDPSFLKIDVWSPFDSIDSFKHQLKLVFKNTKMVLYHLAVYLILFVAYLIIYPSHKEIRRKKQFCLFIYSILIYLPGLLLIVIELRYLIFPILIIILLLGVLLSGIVKKYNKNRWLIYTIFFTTLIILVSKPTYSIINHFNYGKEIHRAALDIKDDIGRLENIASRSEYPLDEDWANSTYIAYVNNGKYYGEVNKKKNQSELVLECSKFNINYLLVWDNQIDLKLPEFKQEKMYSIDLKTKPMMIFFYEIISHINSLFGISESTFKERKKLWIYSFHKQN